MLPSDNQSGTAAPPHIASGPEHGGYDFPPPLGGLGHGAVASETGAAVGYTPQLPSSTDAEEL